MSRISKQTALPGIKHPLRLTWSLAELPSAQHRAGLAGLVLAVEHLRRGDFAGTCEMEVSALQATLTVDEQGLTALMDDVYDASFEEDRRDKPFKNKKDEIIPPLRTEESVEGKKPKTWYIYPRIVPRGSFLTACEPEAAAPEKDVSAEDGKPTNRIAQVWLKLWRDMIWQIYRGVPATRGPYESSADQKGSGEGPKAWEQLTKKLDTSIDLASTYFLGAQANTAELVPFKDRARYQFLLHFAPLVVQIYVPAEVAYKDHQLKVNYDGYALVFPDVCDLEAFCSVLPGMLQNRDAKIAGFRPLAARVDLPVAAGLDLLIRLRQRVQARESTQETASYVLGFDVLHVSKEGNNIRVMGTTRVSPDLRLESAYDRLRTSLKSPLVRQQRIVNLLKGLPWYTGFDRLMQVWPQEIFIPPKTGSSPAWDAINFKHDIKLSFQEVDMSHDPNTRLQELILQVVSTYISYKLDAKYDLKYKDVQGQDKDSEKSKEYQEKRTKIGRDAFLAVRSRTGADFIDYFVATLCSVPQRMKEEDYLILSSALSQQTDDVRTLTMLALSARS